MKPKFSTFPNYVNLHPSSLFSPLVVVFLYSSTSPFLFNIIHRVPKMSVGWHSAPSPHPRWLRHWDAYPIHRNFKQISVIVPRIIKSRNTFGDLLYVANRRCFIVNICTECMTVIYIVTLTFGKSLEDQNYDWDIS